MVGDGHAESGSSNGSVGPRPLLVVDDEPAVCEVLRQYLGRHGFAVQTASTAQQASALASAEGAHFEVILVDKNLPERSGIDLVRELQRARPEATSLIITGYPSRESVNDALKAGASGYIIKPFESLPKVLEAIQEAIDRHRKWLAGRARRPPSGGGPGGGGAPGP